MKIGTDGVLLGAWCTVEQAYNALDIGMGCGLIAIMLAQRCNAKIVGVELDKASFEQARINMQNTIWKNRLTPVFDSVQNYQLRYNVLFDLIVSNPPYFSSGTISENDQKNKVRHTFSLTHGDLLAAVLKLLSKTGKFSLILPFTEGNQFIKLAESRQLFLTKILQVKSRPESKIERLLMQFERLPQHPIKEETLLIYKQEGKEYSIEYIELTRQFYLWL